VLIGSCGLKMRSQNECSRGFFEAGDIACTRNAVLLGKFLGLESRDTCASPENRHRVDTTCIRKTIK
jgi:hypothetical protein